MNKFSFDLGELTGVADKLRTAGDLTNTRELVDEVNKITDEVYDEARGRMIAGINLTDAYLKNKMVVTHATPGRGLSAEIVARGGRNDQTPLSRYMVGPPRVKGDKRRGVQVEVGRGHNVTLLNAFTMPLKRGDQNSGNGEGIFIRSKYGLVRHRYGPAVYQLFRVQAEALEDSIGDTLQERLGRVSQDILQKALA